MKKILIILFFISLVINGFSQDETNTITYTVTNNPGAKLPDCCSYKINISIDYMCGGVPCSSMQTATIVKNQSYVFNFNVDPANLISTQISGEAVNPYNSNPTGCIFSNLSLTQSQVFNCNCYSSGGHTYWTPLGNNTFNIKGCSGM